MGVVVTYKSEDEEIEYPILMKSEDGLLILFRKDECGTVLDCGEGERSYTIGYYSERWDMDKFKKYPKAITIQNK